MSKKSIRIVFVEDKLENVQQVQDELQKAGMAAEFIPLQDRTAFLRQMQAELPQLVLVCYDSNGFAGLDCLKLHKQLAPQVPLIVLSPSVGEERAVELMRAGASNIVLQHKLDRLPAAILLTIQEAEDRLQQQQTEQTAQLNQRHLRNIFRMTPVGVFRCDPDKNCFFVNDRFCEITGLRPEEAIGTGWIDALHPGDKAMVLQGWYAKKREVEEVKSIYRYRNPKTGETSWVIGQSISETDSEGKVIGYLGSVTDITRLKRTEEALKEKNEYLTKVNQELDSFVYSASHNLRAPLTSLMGLISLIRLEAGNPQMQERICNMMDLSLQRLDGFIRDILDHSRNARLSLQYQGVDAKSLVQEVLEEFQLQQEYKCVEVQLKVQQEEPLYTDVGRLRIILRNLISNSIRYHNQHLQPEIDITVRIDAREAVFQINDNGIGIRKEHQARVFDMFYRADEQRSGSGLGLYITHEVVSKIGGTIELSSEHAKGTFVRVTIPNQKHYISSMQPSEANDPRLFGG